MDGSGFRQQLLNIQYIKVLVCSKVTLSKGTLSICMVTATWGRLWDGVVQKGRHSSSHQLMLAQCLNGHWGCQTIPGTDPKYNVHHTPSTNMTLPPTCLAVGSEGGCLSTGHHLDGI